MNNPPNECHPQRTLENVAIFCGMFVVSQVAEFIGDTIHNLHVMDVPQSGVLAIGLVVSGLTTAVADRAMHRSRPDR